MRVKPRGKFDRLLVLQVRGSIPILWEQIVDLSYKPKIKAVNYEETVCLLLMLDQREKLSLHQSI